MDFIEELPMTQNNNKGILTVVDKFSKLCHFIALPESVDAVKVAKLFIANVVRLHGLPL